MSSFLHVQLWDLWISNKEEVKLMSTKQEVAGKRSAGQTHI